MGFGNESHYIKVVEYAAHDTAGGEQAQHELQFIAGAFELFLARIEDRFCLLGNEVPKVRENKAEE